ncbi:hypothetical protein A3H85_02150 [Candidatus Daviesbacteria bacterium RIFCSPLOWO2_02_FULL_40_8]|uniref:Uncharacterized protein n=1 Tax=Candidatus Daviesbacteria bacterium RIFCSPLOWO2_01_FULL_40_24 TaxID=1797787 RepID=A0A1F5MJM1_9BACT|nr:MAG: hypothetical protein A2780_02825 [Candidatus Daviesbacteria bacterium RIFCSPHIGHO2_01_FULL_41_45]OGE35472.1 MAG: hypothetical protein A3C32_03400 [Candidatus Daviesbacteria bacterium RIFCSPHIGHO2_02_FULL_41_14]OGE65562.1 MAG: hypothetical protein A3B49_01980 [Candidatus Daviesbacteria bacterium RIFCSPLOWO2_01_FULL_40_24]OGE67150.1 MAG: hypothetical protein A3H85_02150 [Candidatus Daviesbacteria bacterium RIFCSPLOWO2_02_FULL_40_8]
MKKISLIINETKFKDRPKNLSQEFQVYGIYLAETLADTKHYSLYIKLAKHYERSLLEQALNFVKDANKVKSRGRLFMWKLKNLKDSQGTTQDTIKKTD